MCAICHFTDCSGSCPNCEPPQIWGTCGRCRGEIDDYTDYVNLQGEFYCLDCLGGMPLVQLLDLLDIPIETGEG